MTNLDSIFKSRDITLPTKVHLVKAMVFPVVMWRKLSTEELLLLNCGVGEDFWESLGLQVHPKGNQSWIFIGRTDVEGENPILWPPDVKSWLIWKDPDGGKDWGQEKKGTKDDEMVRWHHQFSGHELAQTLGDSGEQRSLACSGPRGCKELDTT